jgi:hypothetical protein
LPGRALALPRPLHEIVVELDGPCDGHGRNGSARDAREETETSTVGRITAREKLHRLVEELSEAEADAMLTRLAREREEVRQWGALAGDAEAIEDAWAQTNAYEAIRQEPW